VAVIIIWSGKNAWIFNFIFFSFGKVNLVGTLSTIGKNKSGKNLDS